MLLREWRQITLSHPVLPLPSVFPESLCALSGLCGLCEKPKRNPCFTHETPCRLTGLYVSRGTGGEVRSQELRSDIL